MSRQDRIFASAAGLIVLLVVAQFEPKFVGTVLITFSLVVFVLAVVGLVRPEWVRIPNRLASVWVFTLAAGLAMGGAVLISPPNGEMVASDTVSNAASTTPVGRRTLDGNDPASRRWRAELARRRAAVERTAPARAAEAPAPERTNPLLERLMDADGMGMCNIRLQDAARAVYGAGGLYRWTETQLAARFPEKRSAGGDVVTYVGNAIEFRDEDGSWLRAVYECDYDHDAGEIVAVRTSEGRR